MKNQKNNEKQKMHLNSGNSIKYVVFHNCLIF